MGGGATILRGSFSGASITVEQQLHMQKGVQWSSPQSLECLL